MPEASTGGVMQKKMLFKMSQNSQETPVPEETPANFAKFLRTPFLQNNSGRLLLKCGHRNNEGIYIYIYIYICIDSICCRELNAMFYCFG